MSKAPQPVRRGEIWTVAPPGFPKPRPALVVSINPINDLCPDVVMIPLTTRDAPLRVPIDASPEETGLTRASYAKCESLGPIHKSRLKRRIGRIPRAAMRSVDAGVRKVLGLWWGSAPVGVQ